VKCIGQWVEPMQLYEGKPCSTTHVCPIPGHLQVQLPLRHFIQIDNQWALNLLIKTKTKLNQCQSPHKRVEYSIYVGRYTLSEAWSGVNGADLMAAQGASGTDFYGRSTRTIVGTMLWTEYRPVIKIGPKGALGSHEIHPIHSAPSLGQSIVCLFSATIESIEALNDDLLPTLMAG